MDITSNNSTEQLEMQNFYYRRFFREDKCSCTTSEKSTLDETVSDQIHVQALDEMVSVNSFFCVAVFIGLSFTSPNSQGSLVPTCAAGSDTPKYIMIFEIVAFGCYLFSSLIAQGLKLFILVLDSKNKGQVFSAPMNSGVLRSAMLATAVGTVLGTVFMTLSIVYMIQIRLGLLNCSEDGWSKWGAIPLVLLVSTGLVAFISIALYAFNN